MEAEDFWLDCVDREGEPHGGPLQVMWPERFEAAAPVRKIASYQGQRNFTGWYWAATGRAHVGYESWLERDHLMRLDHDVNVAAMASQPFRLSWKADTGRRVSHTPDFFARGTDGRGLVVDVRPDERIGPVDAVKFEATAVACRQVGWGYERVGGLNAVLLANLRWLAGYRHPRAMREPVAELLREAFAGERGLLNGARAVGDPIAVLPVLFHLVWCQELSVDLQGGLLSASTRVRPGRMKEVGDEALDASAVAVGGGPGELRWA